ncbi:MAG: hypothetical protein AVDCRST_MAG59-742, partial [uncultured Thermomicrobiales bacterium]
GRGRRGDGRFQENLGKRALLRRRRRHGGGARPAVDGGRRCQRRPLRPDPGVRHPDGLPGRHGLVGQEDGPGRAGLRRPLADRPALGGVAYGRV